MTIIIFPTFYFFLLTMTPLQCKDVLNISTPLRYPETFTESRKGPDGVTKSSADVSASLAPSLDILITISNKNNTTSSKMLFSSIHNEKYTPSHVCLVWSSRLDLWPSTVWMGSISFDSRVGFGLVHLPVAAR